MGSVDSGAHEKPQLYMLGHKQITEEVGGNLKDLSNDSVTTYVDKSRAKIHGKNLKIMRNNFQKQNESPFTFCY